MHFLISFQRLFKRGKIHEVKVCIGAPEISHLLFTDDSVLFVRANKEECQALGEIISCYEATSGQQINKDKFEVVFSRNVRDDQREAILSELQMVEVNYHAKYLGLPTILGRSKKVVFEGIKERI